MLQGRTDGMDKDMPTEENNRRRKRKKKNNKIKNKIIIDNLSFYTCCGALRTRFAKYFCNTQPQSEKSASPIQAQV